MSTVDKDDLGLFWGESHDNTYQFAEPTTPMQDVLARAASHLDFYAAAYYTACASAFEEGGHQAQKRGGGRIILEGWKEAQRLEREWAEVQKATAGRQSTGNLCHVPGGGAQRPRRERQVVGHGCNAAGSATPVPVGGNRGNQRWDRDPAVRQTLRSRSVADETARSDLRLAQHEHAPAQVAAPIP